MCRYIIKQILIIVLFLNILTVFSAKAQNPSFFQITEEDGLPANKIYNIAKDLDGFIWIGSEAGLSKFDGVRFKEYTHPKQLSKSITGLKVAPSGRIYVFNFRAQIFYVENDSMHLLWERKYPIANIACDNQGRLWLTDETGIYFFNEKNNNWSIPNAAENYTNSSSFAFAKNCTTNKLGEVFFLAENCVFEIKQKNICKTSIDFTGNSTTNAGDYMLCVSNQTKWLFPVFHGTIYKADSGDFKSYQNQEFQAAIKGRKTTNAKHLPDGNIWIPSYSGLIIYNPETEKVRVLFPEIAFSDCLIDNEGNYWFSSLYNGLYRVPKLDYTVWNVQKYIGSSQKTIKLLANNNKVYFATEDGKVGFIEKNKVSVFENEIKSDIQMLYFDTNDQCLTFCTNSYLYQLKNNALERINNQFWPIKSILAVGNQYVVATSIGVLLYNKLNDTYANDTLVFGRSRDLVYDTLNQRLWVSANNGLSVFSKNQTSKWKLIQVFLPEIQVVALDFSAKTNSVYALTFAGELYQIDNRLQPLKIANLPENILCSQLKFNGNKLYLATNKGLRIFDLKTNTWQVLDKFSGIASDNIHALDIAGQAIWLATNKGVQQIPLPISSKQTNAGIFKKQVLVNSVSYKNKFITLKHNDLLHVEVEALTYNSGKNYTYAYRFNTADSAWNFFPAQMNIIPITAIPNGSFELEIRVFDYQNNVSESKIMLKGFKNAPFWQKWWFYLGIALLALWVSFVGFIRRVYAIEKRQKVELQRINLENEMRVSQLTALKAQMNPHFIFNILNSIKAFIYENDKRSAIKYLNSFSDLTRKVLDMSSVPQIKLSEEIELIEIYIELEAMLQDNNFNYKIEVPNNLDTNAVCVPAMLIQPYIENAFKHGLRHKHGSKELKISFEIEQDSRRLIISISDNGIGRAAANIINENSANSHKSFATAATGKRIDLLNKSGEFVALQIIDGYNEKKEPTGTTVLIKLKIHEPNS